MSPRLAWRRPAAAVTTDATEQPESTAEIDAQPALLKLAEYPHAVVSWVADDGYPMNVDVDIEVKPAEGVVRFSEPVGFKIPPGSMIGITGSHVHPLTDGGFDERRHVTVWGTATPRPRGRFVLKPDHVWSWDERDLPRQASYEQNLPKARRYYEWLSAERGFPAAPGLSADWMLFRLTRAPFLTATAVPVLLGLAVATRTGFFDGFAAVITLVAAGALLMGLSVGSGVFDPFSGVDEPVLAPAGAGGVQRALKRARVALREQMLAAGFYAVAAVLWLVLIFLRGSVALVAISALGLFVAIAYSAPPFRLAARVLGEMAAAIVFGPVLLLGAFAVQSRGAVSTEALLASVPAALLVALILGVREVSARTRDAKAGRLTVPVRWSRAAVIRGFDLAGSASVVAIVGGVAAGLLVLPALLALIAIPLGVRVRLGLVRFYDSPSLLMETQATSIQLHLAAGLLLLAGYLLACADQAFLGLKPFLW
jgi:1,4-dihydroxy-2-naphthoate polyprenyltransferase